MVQDEEEVEAERNPKHCAGQVGVGSRYIGFDLEHLVSRVPLHGYRD
jgi:hypothetical protein